MKNFKIISLLILICAVSFSCADLFGDKKPIYLAPVLVITLVSDIKTTSTIVSSTIKTKGSLETKDFGFCYSTNEQPSLKDQKISLGAAATDGLAINTTLTGLLPNTKYYVRAYLSDSKPIDTYGSIASFTTANLTPPKVTIADATDIKFNTFSIVGQIVELGTSDVSEYGHALSETNKEPSIADVITKMGAANTAPKDFKSVFTTLKANTLYYVRSYATNTTGTAYSEVKTVKTGALELAKVSTKEVSGITKTTASVAGSITDQGTNGITGFGHVISKTNTLPTTADTKTSLGVPSSIPKDFVSTFSSLEINTTYYTRAYAISEAGVAYGDVKTFKTLNKIPPTVATNAISNVSSNAANVAGLLSDQGTSTVTNFGHVISKSNQAPSTNDSKTSLGVPNNIPKDYVSTFNQLEANTTYYTRAFAESEDGIGYGEVKSFKTLNLVPPTVTTISAGSSGTSTGSAEGQITSLGTSTSVIDYGFCYSSTNQSPTIADTKKGLGSSTNANQAFKTGFDNLQANTTYYLRAYATSTAGTGYGEVKSFKTANLVPPTVETIKAVFEIFDGSRFFNLVGNVSNDGSSLIKEIGFVMNYNDSPNPTLESNSIKIVAGFSDNQSKEFRGDLDIFYISKVNHFRAYAKNSQGVSYGNDIRLTYDFEPLLDNWGNNIGKGKYSNLLNISFRIKTMAKTEKIINYGFVENISKDLIELDNPTIDNATYKGEHIVFNNETTTNFNNEVIDLSVSKTYNITQNKVTLKFSGNPRIDGPSDVGPWRQKIRCYVITETGKVYYTDPVKNY